MTPKLLAGVLGACSVSLSGCGTLNAAPGAKSGGTDLLDAVKSLTANCSGGLNANLTFAPPLPPSGSLVVNQTCGAASAAAKPVGQEF